MHSVCVLAENVGGGCGRMILHVTILKTVETFTNSKNRLLHL